MRPLVEAAVELRREEQVRVSDMEEPVAPGTCICGCGRPIGGKGRPNRTGYSGYCSTLKSMYRRR